MELKTLYSKTRQCIDAYNMIESGDKIALGISGGKDSLALLYALSGLRNFYPKSFTLLAITVDLGFEDFDLSQIKQLCEGLSVEYIIVKTQIGQIAAQKGCSLCARLRKGALLDEAKKQGCNKIAYAHNLDDVCETMLLSLIYEGRFSTFYPVTYLDDTKMSIIRPYAFVSNSESVGFMNKYKLPVVTNPCTFTHTSQRSYIRGLLSEINFHAPGVKKRLMTAICDGTLPEWSRKK